MGLPKDQFRIVGLEVTPKSIPYGKACLNSQYDEGHEVVWPDQPFEFSYNVEFEMA